MNYLKNRTAMLVVGLVLTVTIAPADAQRADTAAAMLEAAEQKASVEGDLNAAIKMYHEVVNRFAKADRAASATALLRMAEAYEKLGNAQARSTYERIVKEFADQPTAVTARRRLGPTVAGTTKLLRPAWTGESTGGAGTVSGDGRFVSFIDYETSDLAVHDLSTGTNVRLTAIARGSGDEAQDSAISRDGTKIAYSWWINGKTNELRIVSRTSDGVPTPRTLLTNSEILYVAPFDWAPKGDWIAVQVKRRDGTAQIGVVAVSNGKLTTLKTVDWRGVGRMAISPDGASIAYDLPVGDTGRERELRILRGDGTSDRPVDARAGYHVIVGWTPDGTSLLFATERSGTMGLWAVPVVTGVPHGSPQLIEPDLGMFSDSLGVTSSGRLLFTKMVSGINVYTAAIDFATGAMISSPEPITDSLVTDHPGAMWSPDGKFLAYPSVGRGAKTIVIRSLDTGATKELSPRVTQIQFPRWSAPDFITFQGSDLKGRQGIFGLDVHSGEATLLAGGDGTEYRSWGDASQDGKRLVFTVFKDNVFTLATRELPSGEERDLLPAGGTTKAVSPDGRNVASIRSDRTSSWISILPIAGGTPQELLKTARPAGGLGNVIEWLPDGRHLVVGRRSNGKWDRLIVVPLDGGKVVELPPTLEPLGPFFRIHPDGRHVAYSAGDRKLELWILENFLPSANARK